MTLMSTNTLPVVASDAADAHVDTEPGRVDDRHRRDLTNVTSPSVRAATAVLAAVLLAAGGPAAWTGSGNEAASPGASGSSGPFVVNFDPPIGRKYHYPPGSAFSGERWEFCFDFPDGSWTCVPVRAEDYHRYSVGDRV